MLSLSFDDDERIRESLTGLLEARGIHSLACGSAGEYVRAGARTGCDKQKLQRIGLDRLVHEAVLALGRHFVICSEIAANACAVANRSALRLSIA